MKKLATVAAVTALAATPAIADAKKLKHSGQIVGDAETRVTLKLTKKKGKIKKVSRFKARSVFVNCTSGDVRITFTVFDPTKVTKKGNFKERLRNSDGDVLRLKGTVKRRGKKVVGFISTNEFDSASSGTCQAPKQKFKTSKR